MALFSQRVVIPESGFVRLGEIGGNSSVMDGQMERQLGQEVPPRKGRLLVVAADESTVITECRLSVRGYNSRPLLDMACPASVVVEIPCEIVIEGPEGGRVQVFAMTPEDWGQDRGARKSEVVADGPLTFDVPTWAQSFDLSAPSGEPTAVFRDIAANIVGSAGANRTITNHSVPDGAASVDVTGADGTFIVFRQGG